MYKYEHLRSLVRHLFFFFQCRDLIGWRMRCLTKSWKLFNFWRTQTQLNATNPQFTIQSEWGSVNVDGLTHPSEPAVCECVCDAGVSLGITCFVLCARYLLCVCSMNCLFGEWFHWMQALTWPVDYLSLSFFLYFFLSLSFFLSFFLSLSLSPLSLSLLSYAVKECVLSLSQEEDKEKLVASLWGAERCLRVLESVSEA